MEWRRVEPPLDKTTADTLIAFWSDVFGSPYDGFRSTLHGEEAGHNQTAIYVASEADRLGGTCHLTRSRLDPHLGGLGEVATSADFRGRGLARELSRRARDEFLAGGGRAIFLGTHNPIAARLYHALGWRKLAGTQVMCLMTGDSSPEEFLVEHFKTQLPAACQTGSAAHRIGLIPLIVAPHDWQVLDANLGFISTRCAIQSSCMGLYARCAGLRENGQGTWFVATAGRTTVGLSSVRIVSDKGTGSSLAQVDAFAHRRHLGAVPALVGSAIDWARGRGLSAFAQIAVDDEEKGSLFRSLGFTKPSDSSPFLLEGRTLPSIRLAIPSA